MLAEQKNISPLTGNKIDKDSAVLDHCHATGGIRAVLNRWENSVLGRLENWANRVGHGTDPVIFLRQCADYIEHHRDYPSNVLHPTYKTEDEKRLARNAKARKARAKGKT